jgi:GDP-L-fucose synthase
MPSSFYSNKKILVTGGNGFIGTNLVKRLLELNADVKVATLKADVNLLDGVEYVEADLRSPDECLRVARGVDVCFHLAAFGFGFGANLNIQPQLFTNNVLMNTSMLDAAYRQRVAHYLFTSSIAVYDRGLSVLDDNTGVKFTDEPHGSEKYYAYAKRIGEIQCRAYFENYKMNVAIVRLSNPYGPYDTFDLEKSHVIPAFILKASCDGDRFVIRGSGKSIRNFIFVEDVVEGMLLALEKYPVCDPLNLCSSENTSVLEIAQIVLDKTGQKHKRITLDADYPDGVLKRIPLADKARDRIGFSARMTIEQGIEKTVNWRRDNVLEKQASAH